jgi:hypothetical protein
VTLTDLLPTRRDRRKHSPASIIRRLREDIAKLLDWQMAADDYFARLVADRADVYAAWESEAQARQEAEDVAAATRTDLDAADAEIDYLRKRLAPFLAAEANATAITVRPMVRDTAAIEDQATGPIYVQTLRDAAAAGHLGPTLAVTNPGRVPPAWARSEDDTAPVPVVEPDPAA